MATQYERLREALASEVLERVKKSSPQFFERLVILLLVRMGYGGTLKDAGQAVGKSGDGGIDGVIREDKLGLGSICVQAKRWNDKAVGSPDIDQFAGSTLEKKSNQRHFHNNLCLHEGYMIDYGVGVSITSTYEIKKIDSDFFDEDIE